jgi:hypothetical protein
VKFWTAVVASLAAIAVGSLIWLTASGQSPSVWLVESDADVGFGTLRGAIEAANASPGDDIIRFSTPMTIRPRSSLPPLADIGITIEGTDATNGEVSADITPRVWLDGSAAGDAAGLELNADRGVVRGLGIAGFERYGIGVIGVEATGALIEGNWIGQRADGRASANRLSGVAVIGGARGAQIINNRIGGNSVPGQTGHGIVVGGGGSQDASIEDNVIGIGIDGSQLPNDDGILVVDSAQATIARNTIGNSKIAGIELRETRIEIDLDANRVGIRRDGALAPNNVGVFLGPGSSKARIGEIEANVIAGNRIGIAVEQGAREALIENNWIGLVARDATTRPTESNLAEALVRPNRERGISVIAGAAKIRLRNNYVAAGDFGIVVADLETSHVSLTRNVIAGARDRPTEAAIDIRSGTEITIGGESGLGNHVCGAEYGIRVANTEEPSVDSNAVGASAATRVRFDSDARLLWAIRFNDRVVRGNVRNNRITDAERAGISVVGPASHDNSFLGEVSSETSLPENQFSGNGIDIDLGADGRSVNDRHDTDRGPNGLLNHPVIVDHQVVQTGDRRFKSTFKGTATPGSWVHIYADDGRRERHVAGPQQANPNGNWEASISEIPVGHLRALASTSAGATSEFSPSFIPSQRVRLGEGAQWFAWTGPSLQIEQAMSPLLRWIETVWVWKSAESDWQGWSPSVPRSAHGRQGSLERLETGDVVRLQLSARPSRDFFVPAGGEVSGSNAIDLRRGFNSVTWLGGSLAPLEALAELERSQPGLIGSVWQWDGGDWELIWPHLRGAWDPGRWTFPALWIRAIRDGELSLP